MIIVIIITIIYDNDDSSREYFCYKIHNKKSNWLGRINVYRFKLLKYFENEFHSKLFLNNHYNEKIPRIGIIQSLNSKLSTTSND